MREIPLAQPGGGSIRNLGGWTFDMGSLWRLAIWGGAAAGSLALVVLSASSYTGAQRLAALTSGGPSPSTAAAAAANRVTDIENEARRLSEAVRALHADREQLLTRIGTLEHNVEDITGSIKRQAAAIPSTTVAAAASPSPPPAAAQPPLPQIAAAVTTPSAPATVASPAGTRVANAPAATAEEEPPSPPRPEVGVDVGGAVNFNGLRVLWNSLKTAYPGLLEGLHPLVLAHEVPGHAAELRLIIGPIADADAAARFCVTMSINRRHCQPTAFEGQELQLTEISPLPLRRAAPQDRRPVAAAPHQPPRP